MKIKVKATGEIKEVARGIYSPYQYVDKEGTIYTEDDVEELPGDDGVMFYDPTIDYWTRLKHTYAGMAMQGLMTILPYIGGLEGRTPKDEIVDLATATAHALVEKMKESV
jgi:hypothetical protein